jgi:hypothetical protein
MRVTELVDGKSSGQEMPVSQKEWGQIDKKIEEKFSSVGATVGDAVKEAVAGFRPHGWRKTGYLIREIGTPINVIAVFVTLLGITIAALVYAFGHVKDETKFRTETGDQFALVNTQLVSMRALIAANQPARKQNQDAAKELLAQVALKPSVQIPSSVVQQAGTSFVDASKDNQGAWNVALAFVSYRSSENKEPVLSGYFPFDYEGDSNFAITRYLMAHPTGTNPPRLTTSKTRIDVNQSARLEPIGRPMKQDGPDGPASLLGIGGALDHDGTYFRGIVLKDVEIHYNGGVSILENVTFINCRFIIGNDDRGRELGTKILASASVDFHPRV